MSDRRRFRRPSLRPVAAAALAVLAAIALPGPARAQEAGADGDLLDLASGSLVLEYSGQYDETWAAMMLIDATTEYGWASPENDPYPHHFVLELPRRHRLDTLTLSNRGAEDGSYPGISARHVEVLASVEGPDGPWREVATVEVPQGDRARAALPAGTEARWLKLVVRDNWGHDSYTELMEVGAAGEPVGEPPETPPLEGVYDTNYDLLEIHRAGTRIAGCYEWNEGHLNGSTDGRVARFQWVENEGRQSGTAIMVLASDGSYLNGYWYEHGDYQGLWYGRRAPGEDLECPVSLGTGDLEAKLDRGDSAILYGLHFDFDSARLREESRETLRQVLDVLEARPGLPVRLEGHTDSVGSAGYNRDLSRERAAAVRSWLAERGIDAGRLEVEGRGEAEPVAGNDTPQGRALNRRVEIVPLGGGS